MIKQFLFYLKVSRPGLWFATLWLYLLPTSQIESIWTSVPFWIGLWYATFPLNLMVYGWNDMVDYKTDQINPRKDSFWFGAKGSQEQLAHLWKPILVVQALMVPILFYYIGWPFLYLIIAFTVINGLYNLPEKGLRSQPPLELLCQVGYVMVVPFSIYLNDLAPIPPLTYFYLLLFAWQSHLIGEVMDIEPDKKAGRRTTATILGMYKTKLLIIGIVLMEVLLLLIFYKAYIFGGMLAIGLIWLLLDLFIIYKNKNYTLSQMKLFGLLSNLVALASMAYVWYSGCLLQLG